MEVKASCDYDKKCLKTVEKTAKKPIILIMALSLFVICLLLFEIFVLKDDNKIFFAIMFTLVSINLLIVFRRMFIIRKARNKQIKDNIHLDYIFGEESVHVEVCKNGELSATEEMNYKNFVKIKETNDYILVGVDKVRSFVVDKKTIVSGDASDIITLVGSRRKLPYQRYKF